MALDADQKRELAAIAAWLLLYEKRAKNALKKAIGLTARRAIAVGAGQAPTAGVVRAAGRGAIIQIRAGARAGAVKIWQKSTGITRRAEVILASDAPRADRVAASLANAWNHEVDEAIREGTKWPKAANDALGEIQIDRTATTEALDAFDDENLGLTGWAANAGYALIEHWSAALDACPICWDLDGEERIRPDSFDDRPPLHPRCRCFIYTYLE